MVEIQSLARGLKILTLMADAPEGGSVTEVAEALGVDKGSASRLVATLVKYGFAEKDPLSRRFTLGPQVVTLSRSLLDRMGGRIALADRVDGGGAVAAVTLPRAAQGPDRAGTGGGHGKRFTALHRRRDDGASHRPTR